MLVWCLRRQICIIMTQTEACLNSRPLGPLSNNPDDTQVLTPGHFLTHEPLTSLPEPDLLSAPVNRLSRWQLLQRFLYQLLSNYLRQLKQWVKWPCKMTNLQPGAAVILWEDNIPPLAWRLAVTEKIHQGSDGSVKSGKYVYFKGHFQIGS
jgi:hypothetical protein